MAAAERDASSLVKPARRVSLARSASVEED
jgi:hypothetical protein